MLLLDRGYPAAWLINLLNARGIRFVMRCDTSAGGWKALRECVSSLVHADDALAPAVPLPDLLAVPSLTLIWLTRRGLKFAALGVTLVWERCDRRSELAGVGSTN